MNEVSKIMWASEDENQDQFLTENRPTRRKDGACWTSDCAYFDPPSRLDLGDDWRESLTRVKITIEAVGDDDDQN